MCMQLACCVSACKQMYSFQASLGWLDLQDAVKKEFGETHKYTALVPDLSGGCASWDAVLTCRPSSPSLPLPPSLSGIPRSASPAPAPLPPISTLPSPLPSVPLASLFPFPTSLPTLSILPPPLRINCTAFCSGTSSRQRRAGSSCRIRSASSLARATPSPASSQTSQVTAFYHLSSIPQLANPLKRLLCSVDVA